MDPSILGTRIRDARNAMGMTQEELASHLAIPRTAVSDIERGQRGVSVQELLSLSSLLRKSLDYFVSMNEEPGRISPTPNLAMRFRTLNLGLADHDAAFRFEQRCRDYRWLEEVLDAPSLTRPRGYEFPVPRSLPDAQDQGESLAVEERNRLALGSDPVLDAFQVVESQGVRVILMRLESTEATGICVVDSELGACLMVNTALDPNRRSYDLLHEYCHLLVDEFDGANRSGETQDDHDVVERRANAFAAAFLLPQDSIARFMETRGVDRKDARLPDVLAVVVSFGSSFQATVYRLKSLGYLHPQRAEALLDVRNVRELTRRARNLAQVRAINPDDPRERRFAQLTLRAYAEGKISLGRVAELLDIDLVEARTLASLWDEDVVHLAESEVA